VLVALKDPLLDLVGLLAPLGVNLAPKNMTAISGMFLHLYERLTLPFGGPLWSLRSPTGDLHSPGSPKGRGHRGP